MRKEELIGKVKYRIKSYLMTIIVALISLVYVLYQVVEIKPTGLEFWGVIAKGILGIIVGLIIKQGLGENGFTKGYQSGEWLDEKEKYNIACNSAIMYIDKVDDYYDWKRADKKKRYRLAHLQSVRLHYDKFFDKDGEYIEHHIISPKKYLKLKERNIDLKDNEVVLDKHQKRELFKCARVRIYLLNLFSEYANDTSADTHREKTDKDQRAKMFGKNAIGGTLVAIIGAYFVAEFGSWNWASIIVASFQILCWVGTGVLQLYDNYNYITIDKVNKLKTKKQGIQEFIILYGNKEITNNEKVKEIDNGTI